jgi:hypothetical protein
MEILKKYMLTIPFVFIVSLTDVVIQTNFQSRFLAVTNSVRSKSRCAVRNVGCDI